MNNKITDGNYDSSLAVRCKNGTFVGKKTENVIAYKGIPFVGEQPVGELRWKAPVDIEPDDGVYEAYNYGLAPVQSPGDIATEYLNRIAFVLESDDCAEIASGLLSIESDILSPDASQLSEYERTYLLCCLSVGRYSSDFWKEYPQTKAASAKYAIGAIVGADLWGAGEGIFAHGPEILICGVIGGPGCGLAAAARAALVPAITKSAFAGFCAGCGYLAETL